MILILRPGFLFYAQDFQFTPVYTHYFGLHPGFSAYTGLHPGFLVCTRDFQFTLVYTLDFQFTPIYTKSGCKFTHFTLTNCFFQFLQLRGRKEVRTNGAVFPLKKPGNGEKRRGKAALYTLTLGVEPHGNV